MITIYNKQGEINISGPWYTQQSLFDPDNYPKGNFKAFSAFCRVFESRYESQCSYQPKVSMDWVIKR